MVDATLQQLRERRESILYAPHCPKARSCRPEAVERGELNPGSTNSPRAVLALWRGPRSSKGRHPSHA